MRFAGRVADPDCTFCNGSGMQDSGGVSPWDEAILVACDCLHDSEDAYQETMTFSVSKPGNFKFRKILKDQSIS